MAKQLKERVQVGTDDYGKPIYKWATGFTKQELMISAARLLLEGGCVTNSRQGGAHKHPFRDYAQHWFDVFKQPTVRLLTAKNFEYQLTVHLYPAFGDMMVEDITPTDIQKHLNNCQHLAKESQQKQINVLRMIMDMAEEDGFITLNPVKSKMVHLRQYENHSRRYYKSLRQVIENIPCGKTGMLYVPHIRKMKECAEIAAAAGHKPICIWSAANEEHPMTAEQLAARDYILKNEELPPQYDLFIFNASCETSINIRGQVDYFIAHTTNPTHITQARGRYRGDLETLYVFDHESGEPLIVPDEFLDIQLFKEDQQELRLRLSIKDQKGHYLSYPKQWERVETSGYVIDTGRDQNRRYVIIRKTDDEGDGNP